jgi:hypothetical protein
MTTAYTRPRILRTVDLRPGDEIAFAPTAAGRLPIQSLHMVNDVTVWLPVEDVRPDDDDESVYIDFPGWPNTEWLVRDLVVVREAVATA